MSRRLRVWLVLGYVLATLLVQTTHDHGPSDQGRPAEHEAGCADPRPHIAGHWSPDLSGDHDECPACQFRANHLGSLDAPFSFERAVAVAPSVSAAPSAPRRSHLGNACRAPPERDFT